MATAETDTKRPLLDLRGAGADRIALAALVVLSIAATAWLMREGRGLVFFYDEWDWLVGRRDGLDGLLEPNNGHFSLVPVLAFKALYATAGVEPYWVYRLVGALAHLLCVWLAFALVRRRLGPGLALAAATVLLTLGSAWQVLLWPFEISFMFSIAAGMGALLALDAQSRRGDVTAAVLVFVSLASSGLGVAVAAGVLVELLVVPEHRRRVWVALAPLTIYGLWYVVVLPDGEIKRGNADAVPGYVADAAAGAVGAVAGLGLEWGRVLLVLGVLVVIARLLAKGPLPARLLGILATGLTYWALLALARAHLNEPLASRYVYFGAVIVLLIAVQAARRTALSSRAWILLGLAVGASVLANLGDLRDGANGLHGISNSLRAGLAAVELAGDAVAPATMPEPNAAPQITSGEYRELVADLGSPIGGPEGVLDDGPQSAVAVDAALARVLGVAVVPGGGAGAGSPPAVVAAVGGRTQIEGSCVRYTPTGPVAALDVMLNPGSAIVLRNAGASAEVRLRRISDAFSAGPLGAVVAGGAAKVATPSDAISRPWVLRVSPPGPLRACSVNG